MLFNFLSRAHLSQILPSSRRSPLARAAAAGLLAGLLIACSPTYDWRTISNSASGYSVDLPAKPGADERRIDVDGTPMRMRVQTAEVSGAVFVIGTLDLPDAQPATQQKALAFLRAGLARNVGAAPEARTVAVPLEAGGSVEGVDMQLAGKAGAKDEPRTIHARLVAKGPHVYQLAIVGREQPAPEQVDQFFQSFKLY
ncbi:hypothetical protein [Paraburkholderia pallida]|uniref:Transmembrane protein n=1 Tax=Paraburkholderia pallida TaxID=2547399 RepID=A0A4P7CMB8_9BURK|nr:hypothetical protein [Paraburkholderia pallida]QBQ96007.1 hypothetical protein E1956_01640 [Paraburkholderia pallida]